MFYADTRPWTYLWNIRKGRTVSWQFADRISAATNKNELRLRESAWRWNATGNKRDRSKRKLDWWLRDYDRRQIWTRRPVLSKRILTTFEANQNGVRVFRSRFRVRVDSASASLHPCADVAAQNSSLPSTGSWRNRYLPLACTLRNPPSRDRYSVSTANIKSKANIWLNILVNVYRISFHKCCVRIYVIL